LAGSFSERKLIQAIVIDNPFSIAISIIFQSPLHEKFSFSVEVFLIIESALIWSDVNYKKRLR